MGNSVAQFIEEAKRNGGEEIWVEGNKIAKSGKILKKIAEELPNLRLLKAEGCKIKELPSEIKLLGALEILSLQNNKLSSLNAKLVSSLFSLNLSGNRFLEVPEALLGLINLKVLNLSHNQLNSVDVELRKLINLNELNFSFNNIHTFPHAIYELNNLEILNLENNNLTALPPQIGKLDHLRELNVSQNKLNFLPTDIGNLISLVYLNLSKNNLSNLCTEIYNLRTLQILYLQHNFLNNISPNIKNLKKLVELRLNGNKFIHLPEEIGKLHHLRELHLQENELTELPKTICSLHFLRKLKLEFNHLDALPEELANLNLEVLYLHNNRFKQLPEPLRYYSFIKNLLYLSLENNPLDEFASKRMENGALQMLRELHKNPSKKSEEARMRRLSTQLFQSSSSVSEHLLTEEEAKDKKKRSTLSTSKGPGTFSRNSFSKLKKVGTEATKRLTLGRLSMRDEELKHKRKNSDFSRSETDLVFATLTKAESKEEPDQKEIPSFNNFKDAFSLLLEIEDFSEFQKDALQRASPQEKWQFLRIYNGENILNLLSTNNNPEDTEPTKFTGKQYAQFLQEPHNRKLLHKICTDLRVFLVLEASAQPMWVYQFLKQGGIEALTLILQVITSKSELTEDENAIEYECVRCLRLLASMDFFSILNVLGALESITLCLNSKNVNTTQVVIGILEYICLGGHVGHKRVLESLKYFDEKTVKRSTVVIMEPFYEENLDYKISSLSLINGLIVNVEDLEERFEIRNQFLIQGLLTVVEELNKVAQKTHQQSLVTQLHIFDEELANDTVLMVMQSKKKNKKRNSDELPRTPSSALLGELKYKSESFGNNELGNRVKVNFVKHGTQVFPFTDATYAGEIILKMANYFPYISPELHNHALHISQIICKSERGGKKTILLDLWIEEDEKFSDYHLQGEITAEFKIVPNLMRIRILKSIKKIQFDPLVTCGEMVETLLQFIDKTENIKDDLEGEWRIVSPDGIWMDPSKTISEYRIRKKAIYELKKKSKPRSLSSNGKEVGASDGGVKLNVNIWEEPSGSDYIFLHPEKTEISAASLNKLIQELTSEESYEPDFVNAFLYTYHSFTTSEELFSKLIERYHVPSHIPEQKKRIVQLRVCLFMKYWIEKAPYDVEPLISKMEAFFNEEMTKGGYSEMIPGVRKALLQLRNEETSIPGSPKIRKVKMNILEFNEKELAEQLTLIHFSIYKKITPSEFFNLAWTKSTANKTSPNLLGLVNHFNYISNWVASSLVSEEKLKDRVLLMKKFINLAIELRKINNFSLVTSIISGFNNSAVTRLKWTKSKLPKMSKYRLQALETEMEFDNSYKNYRLALENTSLPAIPYIGVCLGDLTFIEQGNQDFVHEGLVNWEKCKLIYTVIEKIIFLQKVNYSFEPNRELQRWVSSFEMFEEEELFRKSLAIEPKDASKNDIK